MAAGWGVVGAAGFLALWELTPRLGLVSATHLPPPSEVAVALADLAITASFWRSVGDTLLAWGLGLGIALAAALVLGFLVGSVPVLQAYTRSTVEFLRPIPSVALVPLAVLLFATDIRSSLLLVVYASFWQIYVQVLHGVADTDPVAERTALSYRLGRLGRLRYVTIPSALPYVFTGLRLAAAVALILAITAEMIIGSPGLGRDIATARSSAAPQVVYALVVVTGAIGVSINLGVRLLERRALRWHPALRSTSAEAEASR